MADDELQASFDRLGLSLDANMREVERSFRELRDLYGDESLATYSLLEYADRQDKLESLQAAYDCILSSRLHTQPFAEDGSVTVVDEQHLISGPHIICVDADPEQMPGLFLQQMREARGLSLHDVAQRTKIGSFQLQGIEEQRFDILPAPVYLRGFLKEYAREVEAPDAEALINSFIALYLNDRDL